MCVATVVETTVDAEDLVPGDIVILNAGDRVPADARLLECYCLQTEESALTGESTPVDKAIEDVREDNSLSERRSMVYLGTAIAAGRAVAIVVDTGAQTELGRVGQLVATSMKERSPLEIRLTQLGHRLVYIVLAHCVCCDDCRLAARRWSYGRWSRLESVWQSLPFLKGCLR